MQLYSKTYWKPHNTPALCHSLVWGDRTHHLQSELNFTVSICFILLHTVRKEKAVGKKKKLWVLFYHLTLITRWGVNAAADLLVDRGLTCLIDLLISLNCWPTPPTLTEGTDLPQVNTLPKVDSNCTLLHALSAKTKRQPGCGWRHCWLQVTSFCHCACLPVTDTGGCWQEKRKKNRKDWQGSL